MDVALRIYPRSFQDANGDGTGDTCHILPPMLEGPDPFAETSSLQKLRSNSSHRLCIIMCYLECLQRGLIEGLIWLSMISKKNWNNQQNTYWPGSATTHQCGVHYPQVKTLKLWVKHVDRIQPQPIWYGLFQTDHNEKRFDNSSIQFCANSFWDNAARTWRALNRGCHISRSSEWTGNCVWCTRDDELLKCIRNLYLKSRETSTAASDLRCFSDTRWVSSSQNLGQNAEWILKATGAVHCLTDADSVRHVDLVWPCHPAPWATTSDSFGQQFEDENDFIMIPEWSDLDLFGLQVFNLEELGVGFVWVSPIMKSPMRDFGPGTRRAHGFYMFLSGGRKNDAIPAILKSYTEMEATINNHSCHHLQRWHGDVPCEFFFVFLWLWVAVALRFLRTGWRFQSWIALP